MEDRAWDGYLMCSISFHLYGSSVFLVLPMASLQFHKDVQVDEGVWLFVHLWQELSLCLCLCLL